MGISTSFDDICLEMPRDRRYLKRVFSAWEAVNKAVLQSALYKRKAITLDIDATEIIANKSDAKWTYKKNTGYTQMVSQIAETGQIVACDFRAGNASPARENLEFIQQCQQSLPDGCFVQSLRIDTAGYQTWERMLCGTSVAHYLSICMNIDRFSHCVGGSIGLPLKI